MGTESAAQKTYSVPNTTQGLKIFRSIAIVNTGLVAKNKPGKLYSIQAYNINAAVRYLKIYNKATAADATDTPVMTIPLPVGQLSPIYFDAGVEFSLGISVRAVTGIADNDNTAPTVNETIVNIGYY